MAGFANVRAVVAAYDAGAVKYATWRKTASPATLAGYWFDLSMSPGNPLAQYYANTPLKAAAMARSTDGGLDHGGNVSPAQKYLHRFMAMSITAGAVPLPLLLCDYLLMYPFCDEAELSTQYMDNTVVLPRYSDGVGVQMMAVVVAPQVGGQTFSVSYTNSAGVSGRQTPNVTMCAQGANGTLLSTSPATAGSAGPFLPLQAGDNGVLRIDSVLVNGTGDIGLFTLVLVKPLAQVNLRGIDAPVEVEFLPQSGKLVRVIDDAYLNLLCCPAGSLAAAPIHGDLSIFWG